MHVLQKSREGWVSCLNSMWITQRLGPSFLWPTFRSWNRKLQLQRNAKRLTKGGVLLAAMLQGPCGRRARLRVRVRVVGVARVGRLERSQGLLGQAAAVGNRRKAHQGVPLFFLLLQPLVNCSNSGQLSTTGSGRSLARGRSSMCRIRTSRTMQRLVARHPLLGQVGWAHVDGWSTWLAREVKGQAHLQ